MDRPSDYWLSAAIIFCIVVLVLPPILALGVHCINKMVMSHIADPVERGLIWVAIAIVYCGMVNTPLGKKH